MIAENLDSADPAAGMKLQLVEGPSLPPTPGYMSWKTLPTQTFQRGKRSEFKAG